MCTSRTLCGNTQDRRVAAGCWIAMGTAPLHCRRSVVNIHIVLLCFFVVVAPHQHHCPYPASLAAMPRGRVSFRHCLAVNEALIFQQCAMRTHRSVPECILAPTEHVTGPRPTLIRTYSLNTETRTPAACTQHRSTLPFSSPASSVCVC